MAKYAMFWGCQIPARLPFAEKATRLVMDQLDVPFEELEGFTCCPERELIRTADEDLWYLAAARNLALAEERGLNLLTPCNGCYSTQKDAIYQLKLNPRLHDDVNGSLGSFDLEYRGRVQTKHLVEFFHDDLGLAAIQSRVRAPLAGMKVAVHPGCHLVRPFPAINFDDPIKPIKFDAVVEALGAKSVAHSTKMLCCGQGFNAAEEAEHSAALPAEKLRELKALGVKALVTCCPTCFMQYDYKQAIMRRQGEDTGVAVFYLPELMALAFGYEAEEIGLGLHRSSVEPFFREWERARHRLSFAKEHFDLPVEMLLVNCGGCVTDCPAHRVNPAWNPNTIMGRIVSGEAEDLLESKDIWQCIDCFVCDEMCPQRWSMRIAFETLRHLAIQRGHATRGAKNAVDGFRKVGKLIEATESHKAQRAKLGLPPPPRTDLDVARRLADAAKSNHLDIPHELSSDHPSLPEDEELPVTE